MTSFLPFWNTAEVVVNKPDNESCFPSLSFKERVIGFITCFVLGTFFCLLFLNYENEKKELLSNFCRLGRYLEFWPENQKNLPFAIHWEIF